MGKLLYTLWRKTARANADRVAVRVYPGGIGRTFAEMASAVEGKIDSHRSFLRANNIVLIQMANSADWLEAFLSCQAAGAIALAVDPDVPPEGVSQLLPLLRPCALWNESGLQMYPNPTTRKPACLIKLTSGSTGTPRPLVFEDAQMLADGHSIIATMGIGSHDVNLAAIPFGHSYGLGNLVLPLIIQGTSIAVSPDPFPFSLAHVMEDSRATVFPAVPTLLDGLVRADIPRGSLASVRLFISAGSPLAASHAREFTRKFRKQIHNFYGSSETGGIAYDRSGEDTLSGRAIGTPMEGVDARISPSGRLLVSGPAVLRRGNRRAGKQASAFLLPDLASQLPDGSIALVGRKSRQIKLAGKRLNLAEVEKCLLEVDGVSEACVVDFHDRNNRLQLAAAIVSSIPPEVIREQLKQRLPVWKIPGHWAVLDSFPTTSRGKVNFKVLRESALARLNNPAGP